MCPTTSSCSTATNDRSSQATDSRNASTSSGTRSPPNAAATTRRTSSWSSAVSSRRVALCLLMLCTLRTGAVGVAGPSLPLLDAFGAEPGVLARGDPLQLPLQVLPALEASLGQGAVRQS